MRRVRPWQLAGLLLTLAVTRLADAQDAAKTVPLNVALEYEAPDDCLTQYEFRAIVRKRLGRDPFVEAAPNRVLAFVSQAGGVLSGDIIWRDDVGSSTGQRHFPSTTNRCGQLVEAMAFALAIQIQLLEIEVDQRAKSATGDGASAPATPQKSAQPVPDRPSHDPPIRTPNQPEPVRRGAAPFIGGGGGLAFGMSSSVVPIGRLFVGLRWTAVATELGLEASLPVTTHRADGAGFSQWHLLTSAAGCVLPEPFGACALLKVGTVRVTGRDIDEPHGTGTLLAQTGLRVAFSPHLSAHTVLSLRAEGLVNLTRWSVMLDQTPVWSSPPFAVTSGLDFTVLFQ
ncbi:MAG TPA: hypothetical protein VHM25_02885 [Polyangiaceae bacterium]|nr:hypothetical protein [Polyangiaceae bacterium]